jgi:hypothetical protein
MFGIGLPEIVILAVGLLVVAAIVAAVANSSKKNRD